MNTNANADEPLPPGVWFEKSRNRYRVRLYFKSQPIHLSYHRTLREALDALSLAKRRQHNKRHPTCTDLDEHQPVHAYLTALRTPV